MGGTKTVLVVETDTEKHYRYECAGKDLDIVVFGIGMLQLIGLLFYCFQGRIVAFDFNEIVHLLYSGCFGLLIGIMVYPMDMSTKDDPETNQSVWAFYYIIAVIFFMMALLVPKIISIMDGSAK